MTLFFLFVNQFSKLTAIINLKPDCRGGTGGSPGCHSPTTRFPPVSPWLPAFGRDGAEKKPIVAANRSPRHPAPTLKRNHDYNEFEKRTNSFFSQIRCNLYVYENRWSRRQRKHETATEKLLVAANRGSHLRRPGAKTRRLLSHLRRRRSGV